MKSRVTWIDGKTFAGQTESGHSVVVGTADGDSPKPGPSAMELVLIGAGSCAAWDVVEFLRTAGQPIEDVTIDLDADRAETSPKVFTRIHLIFTVKGRALSQAEVHKAITASLETYCSGMAMMTKTATVTHAVHVVDTA